MAGVDGQVAAHEVSLMLLPDAHQHGTMNGYENYECRCDLCREAAKQWRIDRRKPDWKPRTAIQIRALPGTVYRYDDGGNLLCTCPKCRPGLRDDQRFIPPMTG
jgi:hypothetical protein